MVKGTKRRTPKQLDGNGKKYKNRYKRIYYCRTCGAVLPNGCQKYCLDCLLRAYQSEEQRPWAKDVLHSRGYDEIMINSEIAERTSR